MRIQTINPTTGQVIHSYEEMSEVTVSAIIDSVEQSFQVWSSVHIAERALKMHRLGGLLRKRRKEYARLIATEMGKPVAAGEAEIEKCAWVCSHYAVHAEDYLKLRAINTELSKSYVMYEPLGVILGIMPWNFPFWQVFRFAAPNIMAGNAILLKHAPISTSTALVIEQVFRELEFPEHLLRALVVDNESTLRVIHHPKVAGITLTGSVNAGKIVAAEAAKAIKKSVLELGGNDPYLVLEDADLELAAEACVTSRMANAGQVCIAAKRILVVDSIHEEFKKLILTKLTRYQFGDPLDEATTLGPLARADLREHVHKQVQESIAKGAVLLAGGEIPVGPGFYYPPTVLDAVQPGMPAYEEEIFGPVISLIPVKNEDDAIQVANDTCYGLSAAIFTQDLEKAEAIATKQLRTGSCAINMHVSSDPRLPFGGIKNSGYGRELGEEGIHAFMNVKTIYVK